MVERAAGDRETVARTVKGALRFEGEGHVWVAVSALQAWLGEGAEAQAALKTMIAKAKPFGWVAEDGQSVRAHVDWL